MNDYRPSSGVLAAGSGTLGRLYAEIARRHADLPAIVDGDSMLTHGQFNARVNRLAQALAARGIGRGDRIGLLARNGAAYLEVELAAAKLGAITASQNWRLPPPELAHCIGLVDPALLIVQPDYLDVLAAAGADARPRLVLGADYERALRDAPDVEPPVPVAPEDGLVIIYTSGTTGLPKGALISHRAMIARTLIYAAELGAPAHDTFVAWTPLFHMGANDFSFATLLRGGCVVVIDGYRPEPLIDAAARWPIHYFTVIPGMIGDFIERVKAAGLKPRGIAMIGAMADLVPRAQLAEITTLLGAPYLNTFGSTETGIAPATGNFIAIGEAPARLSKRQNQFCEVRLVDPDDNDVPAGEPGELAIRGPSLFSGYWNNEAANTEAFRNGWFHMGDVFRRNPDGTLDFVDRVKYLIKSGGENIYPAEIEQHVLADPRIADAAVVRRADARWGEVPVLFAAPREGAEIAADEVIALCRGRIANYKLPKAVHIVAFDELPRSTTGKILRHELEARLARRQDANE